MAATPEKKVKNKVVEVLKAHGVYYFFPATYGMGRSGVPDIICCYQGRFLAIECKAGAGKTTALQDRELDLIKKAGGVQMVVNEKTVGEVAVLLNVMKKTELSCK
ncbi:Restriction_endonuclease_like domain containing protein [uncultured Caudovirales phage]|uniref:Restriction_endonuclease_like domain containing protein n=1 Tax=uncultured Caudovirales phage TaxID=2100421 RepID=A0A6J5QZU9_9CAUD|nr:Restriction_endonuclease_like domain containing protein [uncultured Caudovirales phage]